MIDRIFQAHSQKQLEEAKAICVDMLNNGISLEQFIQFVETKQKAQTNLVKVPPRIIKVCPECEGPMYLFAGDDNDSEWVCPKCRFSEYNSESVPEVIGRLIKEKKDGKRTE